MGTFKVDGEQINNTVNILRKLLNECEEVYSKEIPESTVDKGLTHTELEEFCKNIKTNCQYLGELINNTIRFLGEASEMFETSDRESAEEITVPVEGILLKNNSKSQYTNSEIERINRDNVAEGNSSYSKEDSGYIENGCVITSVSNLYRRKEALDGWKKEKWTNKQTVYEYNEKKAAINGDVISKILSKETGYEMINKDTPKGLAMDELKEMLKDRPEGICVYAKADTGDHAILITSVEEGSFKVIDAIDGGNPIEFAECSAVKYGKPNYTSIFDDWTTEKLLSRIKWVKYIE